MRNDFRWMIAGIALTVAACGTTATVTVPTQQVVTTQVQCAEQWVQMPMMMNFATASATLDYSQREILRELVASAQSRPDLRRVRVEGHTDTCGNELNNMMLSQQRAQTVAAELVTMGVPRQQIDIVGHGSTRPRANESCTGNQSLSQQTNRRVEFSLLVCR